MDDPTEKPPDISLLSADHPLHNEPTVSVQSGTGSSRALISWPEKMHGTDSSSNKKRKHDNDDELYDNDDELYDDVLEKNAEENLFQLGDNNILPYIKQDGTCSLCNSKMSSASLREELIECSSCSKKFHTKCEPLMSDAKKKKLLILPNKTEMKYFSTLMERNGHYYGGEFGGFKCRSCVSLSTLKENMYRNDRLNIIESLLVEQKPLRALLESVIQRLDALEASSTATRTMLIPPPNCQDLPGNATVVANVNSYEEADLSSLPPPDKSLLAPPRGTTFDSAWGPPVTQPISRPKTRPNSGNVASSHQSLVPAQQTSGVVTPVLASHSTTSYSTPLNATKPGKKNLFRVRAKALPEEKTHIERIFARHSARGSKGKGALKRYNCRSRGKDGMDLLFSSYEEALAEFNSVANTLKDEKVSISKPEMLNLKRAYLVGLDHYHFENPDLVLEEILDVSQNAWLSDHIKNSCFKVVEVKSCLKDKHNFRATLELSEEVLAAIVSHSSKLRVGYLNCTVYPFTPHYRCGKCQVHGHRKDSCKHDQAVCAKCAGNHLTNECTSDVVKCINCFNDDAHKEGCMTHSADSNCCPVFIAARLAERRRASKK